MLKKYQNELCDIIKELNLTKTDFSLQCIPSNRTTEEEIIISIKNTKLSFHIYSHIRSFYHFTYRYTLFNPIYNKTNLIPRDNTALQFDKIAKAFKDWLAHTLKDYWAELETPNKWDFRFDKKSDLLSSFFTSNNDDLFEESEKKQIRRALTSFGEILIANNDLPKDKLDTILQEITFIQKNLDKMSKKAWQNHAIGGIISAIIAMTLSPDVGQYILNLFINLLSFPLHPPIS